MYSSLPLHQLNNFGSNPPVNPWSVLESVSPTSEPSASRFRLDYGASIFLDALLINKNSDTLIVSLHGAINRKKVRLPRFERLSTLLGKKANSMFFTDPGLYLDEEATITWFTGWNGVEVQKDIARSIEITAKKLNCHKVVIIGDSGGGFAALQISALIPQSICVAFDPTTTIFNYFDGGNRKKTQVQERFIKTVFPQVLTASSGNFNVRSDWTTSLSDSVSALRRYSAPTENWVVLVQNRNDWHYDQHYLPFLAACARGKNLSRVHVMEIVGRSGHFSPTRTIYESALSAGLYLAEIVTSGNYFQFIEERQGVLRAKP